jgi:hypothetical protein
MFVNIFYRGDAFAEEKLDKISARLPHSPQKSLRLGFKASGLLCFQK